MSSADQWSRRRVRDPDLATASLSTAVTVYLSFAAWRDDRGSHLAISAGRVRHDPDTVVAAPVVPGQQVGDRWHQQRSPSRPRPRPAPRRREAVPPAKREISYDVARYLALDTIAAMGGLAGFSIAGPPGMLAGFLATAVARGVVSGTIGVLRSRGTHEIRMRQQERAPTGRVDAGRRAEGNRALGPGRQQQAGRRGGRSDTGRRARDERRRSAEGPMHGR